MSRFRAPEVCPLCGADVPKDALACPECGADERTGWSDEARCSGLDLPDDGFDYDEFVAREFGGQEPRRSGSRFWWAVGVMLLLALLWAFLGRFW